MCSTYIISFNPHNNHKTEKLLSPFFTGGEIEAQEFEQNNFSKVTYLYMEQEYKSRPV